MRRRTLVAGDWLSAGGNCLSGKFAPSPHACGIAGWRCALALSGAVMQALFENPLAEPGLLGVSNGAGVGLVPPKMYWGRGGCRGWALGLCAIARRAHCTLILLRFARRHLSTSRLLLAGVALEHYL